MEATGTNPVVGTGIKLSISMTPVNDISLKSVDWEVLVCSDKGFKELVIPKEDAVYIDDDTYVICVDTNLIGPGRYYTTITVYIPDDDFDKGFRLERHKSFTGVTIDPQ